MRIQVLRDDAAVEPADDGYYAVRAVQVQEFLAHNDRVVPLHARTELNFRPNIIYKAYTGIALPQFENSAGLLARATAEAWKHGLSVLRLEFQSDYRELIVYFSTLQGFNFYRTQALFEITPIRAPDIEFFEADAAGDLRKAGVLQVEKGPAAPAPGPQKATDEGMKLAEAPRPGQGASDVNPDADEDAAAEAKVRSWLNEPDEKGHIVAQGKEADDVTRPTRPANVNPVSEASEPQMPRRSEAVLPEEYQQPAEASTKGTSEGEAPAEASTKGTSEGEAPAEGHQKG